jgi:hypothetical protein
MIGTLLILFGAALVVGAIIGFSLYLLFDGIVMP